MKRTLVIVMVLFLIVGSLAAQLKVVSVKGDVSVRHGINEQWVAVAQGDVLKPEDSIRLAKKASATLLTENKTRLQIPEMTVLDLSDLRMLTQEELLLKLAMERVRVVPDKGRENDFHIPRTTTMHGANMGGNDAGVPQGVNTGVMQINGVKVLYNNGFYATSVLKAKEIFRLVPQTASMIDARLLVAGALEKMDVNAEALTEYTEIAKEQLSQSQRSVVEGKIAQLKKNH
jgi:hypothetical protein